MDIIHTPFSNEQVENINNYQTKGSYHPFTCCGDNGCDRNKQENHGILIAKNEGLICPCGKYKQDWVHSFMSKNNFNL